MAVSVKIPSIIAALFLVCSGAFALAQGDVVGRSPGADFNTVQGKGVLTIAGEGYWHRQTYEEGELPVLSSYDSSGQVLPDGIYRYEFWIFTSGEGSSPRQRDLAQSKGAGVSASSSKKKRLEKQSGGFEIKGGEWIFR